jgi:hypothetical protein
MRALGENLRSPRMLDPKLPRLKRARAWAAQQRSSERRWQCEAANEHRIGLALRRGPYGPLHPR